MKKIKKPMVSRPKSVKVVVPKVASRFRRPSALKKSEDALHAVPRITNETVAEHREEVLRGARKYKYPLQHSKHKIVIVSTGLLVAGIVGFLSYIAVQLYRFQDYSTLTYRMAQIIPFPVAKAGNRWVSFESYLFELRRYVHYYETQQQVDFSSESGKYQMAVYKPKALQQVIDTAYVKELAQQNGVKVTQQDVNDAIMTLRTQNQLGSSDKELATVTRRFFGWSVQDLRRQLSDELLAQKVAAKLDMAASARAKAALAKVQAGEDFGTLAAQLSDDQATKGNGGVYNDTAITLSSQEVPTAVVRALDSLKPGGVAGIITTPTSFEIVKLLSRDNGKAKAAHIEIRFADIQTYLQPLEKKQPAKHFVKIKEPAAQQTGSPADSGK